ncbi:Fur family ferric uptake transcriptional regulator [Anaerobacterium chartisolvens]|uniref:Fur family ferric uptake transcriptional regulator n=1 Tax=Anaerobacterium chartisolvens TaxID=1297424 RepID=A0A369BDF5_9FIRM|nr:transcriptional repressor [Anaerobacterium chartisolvens]RCX19431.1 Fur family ferric uptake transcriptional regulator [Anaerobacterium chartisolvens]
MIETGSYTEVLRREGLRNTKHRNSILETIEGSGKPVTAEEIFLNLKSKNISINLSSVYRALDILVFKEVVVKSTIADSSSAFFEINKREHKHNLICSGCKKIFPVDGCPLEEYEKLLQDKTGFDVTGHRLEIYGYCHECKEEKKYFSNE